MTFIIYQDKLTFCNFENIVTLYNCENHRSLYMNLMHNKISINIPLEPQYPYLPDIDNYIFLLLLSLYELIYKH